MQKLNDSFFMYLVMNGILLVAMLSARLYLSILLIVQVNV